MRGLIGKNLGHYKLIEKIGEGGMAVVYLASQETTRRKVAIKVLPPAFSQDEIFLQRFYAEVELVSSLQHPHIVPIYDYGKDGDIPFVVMAYLQGGTLEKRISQGYLDLKNAARIITQLGSALDYAHQQNIIHRDFKPSNILLDDQQNAYLADFGIAKLLKDTTAAKGTGIAGTPPFMAPEMVDENIGRLTSAADVYALGVTLYYMLSGTLPFTGPSAAKILLAHLREPVPDIRKIRPDLPAEIQPIIEKAMAKSPEDRFRTASALAEILNAVSIGMPVEVPLAANGATPVVAETPEWDTVPVEYPPAMSQPAAPSRLHWIRNPMVLAIALTLPVLAVLGALLAGGLPNPWVTTNSPTESPTRLPVTESPTQTVSAATTTTVATPVLMPWWGRPTALGLPIMSVGNASQVVQADSLGGDMEEVRVAAWSPSGAALATGSLDGKVFIWANQWTVEGTGGDIRLDLPIQDGAVWALDWSPTDTLLATTGDDAVIHLWRLSSQDVGWSASEEAALSGHTGTVRSLRWSPDGTRLVSGSSDRKVILWDVAQRKVLLELAGHEGSVFGVDWSPDGTKVVSGSLDSKITIWDVQDGQPLGTLSGHTQGVETVVWSPDGTRIVSGADDGTVIIWDAKTAQPIHQLDAHPGGVFGLAWSPDSAMIASGGADGSVALWDAVTGALAARLTGHTSTVESVRWSPSGELLASASHDRRVIVWGITP